MAEEEDFDYFQQKFQEVDDDSVFAGKRYKGSLLDTTVNKSSLLGSVNNQDITRTVISDNMRLSVRSQGQRQDPLQTSMADKVREMNQSGFIDNNDEVLYKDEKRLDSLWTQRGFQPVKPHTSTDLNRKRQDSTNSGFGIFQQRKERVGSDFTCFSNSNNSVEHQNNPGKSQEEFRIRGLSTNSDDVRFRSPSEDYETSNDLLTNLKNKEQKEDKKKNANKLCLW